MLLSAASCTNNNGNGNDNPVSGSHPVTNDIGNGNGSQPLTNDTGLTGTTSSETTVPSGEAESGMLYSTPEEIIGKIYEKCDADLVSTWNTELNADNSEDYTGLKKADYEKYVLSGCASEAMMSAQPHLVCVLKCRDAEAADAVKNKIAAEFNVMRWVCVTPEKAYAVDCKDTVFLVASYDDSASALYNSFLSLCGSEAGEKIDISVPS